MKTKKPNLKKFINEGLQDLDDDKEGLLMPVRRHRLAYVDLRDSDDCQEDFQNSTSVFEDYGGEQDQDTVESFFEAQVVAMA